MLGRIVSLIVVLLLCCNVATARKEYTRKQVGSFFRQYPRMEKLIFKAMRAQEKAGKPFKAVRSLREVTCDTLLSCYTFAGQTECDCPN